MESIQELRDITQKSKLEGRERPWGYRTFQRGPSIYISRIFLHTSVTPDQLTVLSIWLGLAGCILITLQGTPIKLFALFLLYLNLIFDRVDGEVARYRKEYSLIGIYLDEINHLVIPPLFFIATAWGIVWKQPLINEAEFMLIGSFAAIAVILLRVTHNIPYQIFLKKYLKYRDNLAVHTEMNPAEEIPNTTTALRSRYQFIYSILFVLHQFQDFFITLVVFAIAYMSEYYFSPAYFLYPYSSWLLIFYTILLWLIVFENIAKGVMGIKSRMSELEGTLL